MSGSNRPKNAATVILLRAEPEGVFEVFMTLRPQGMDFLGGYYVFPGGSVRKEDWSEVILRRCRDLTRIEAQRILGNHLPPELSLGHWVAAIRELFEEVGVLLCVDEGGNPLNMKDGQRKERLAQKRQALMERAIDFPAILESEKLLCDVARLRYFSHWQTPEEFPIRFDTRFYLALLPQDQNPLATSPEVSHSLWITPERAIRSCEQDKLPAIFPTYAALRTLADFDSLESLFSEYRPK